jgi:hypothetical protein
MIVGPPLPKQSGEVFPFSVDFASEIAVGETITAAVFRAIKESDGSVATTTLEQASRTITGSVVAQEIKAGTAGETYMLELKITTSLGHIWEAERQLIVRDVP